MASNGLRRPTNWPSDLQYLHEPRLSKALTPEAHQTLATPPTGTAILTIPAGPCVKVRIKSIEEPTHPAHGQHGLFASQQLPPGTLILQYLGMVHTEAESDPSSNYDLSLDRESGIGIDATFCGNEARFMNDYRGVANGPNAEFIDAWVDVGRGRTEKRMVVYVLSAGKSGKRVKGIAKGQEILVSYGKGFWQRTAD